ncbi:hypothetical protein T12_16859, partial [Trichinella patagoniensis]
MYISDYSLLKEINHAPSDIVCCCYGLSIALARSSRFDICSVALCLNRDVTNILSIFLNDIYFSMLSNNNIN